MKKFHLVGISLLAVFCSNYADERVGRIPEQLFVAAVVALQQINPVAPAGVGDVRQVRLVNVSSQDYHTKGNVFKHGQGRHHHDKASGAPVSRTHVPSGHRKTSKPVKK